MIKLAELSKAVFGTKIQNPTQLSEVLSKRHSPTEIFGVSFSPKFKLTQDVFDAAALKQLEVPKGVTFKFIGEGNRDTSLRVHKDATFIAPFAKFGDAVVGAKNAVIYSVKNLVSTAGKTDVQLVTGNNLATRGAKQEISVVIGNNEAFGNSSQKIDFLEGNNKSYNEAHQNFEYIKGNSDAFDSSFQSINDSKGYVSRHQNAKVEMSSLPSDPRVIDRSKF